MTPIRKVAILGSTGSIGRQALEVISERPDRLQAVALVAGSDGGTLATQARRHGVEQYSLGGDAAVAAARSEDVDVVLNAVVGAAGLQASIAALEAGKVLALANKESMVAGGEVCLAAARRGGGRIVPVDSEHAALAQCLENVDRDHVERVVLTASGGPFRDREDLEEVTVEEALEHPTWSMGPKITVDSATLMNKGLEVIEAHFLFGFPYDRIDTVLHPQSVVHAIALLRDGSMLMQAAPPDMRIPIAAALMWPERDAGPWARIDPSAIGRLDMDNIDHERFPALRLAYEAGRREGTFPAALNAANEVAVSAFLAGQIPFTSIVEVCRQVLDGHEPLDPQDLDSVLEADRVARRAARALVERPAEVGR